MQFEKLLTKTYIPRTVACVCGKAAVRSEERRIDGVLYYVFFCVACGEETLMKAGE